MTERNNRIDPTNQPNECSSRLMSTNHSFRNVSPHVRNYFIKFVEGSDVKFPDPIFMEIYILEKSMKISGNFHVHIPVHGNFTPIYRKGCTFA